MPLKGEFAMRQVLEVRFPEKHLAFVDYKGQLLDGLLQEFGFSRFKFDGERVEVLNDVEDRAEVIFASWENMGLQMEVRSDYRDFKDHVQRLITYLEEFGEYPIDSVIRIGTKVQAYYSSNKLTKEGIREKYLQNFFPGYKKTEEQLDADLIDVGYFVQEWNLKNGLKMKVSIGPSSKDEVRRNSNQFGGVAGYRSISKEHGVYIELDLYNDEKTTMNATELGEALRDQIQQLEEIVEKYISCFVL